MEAPSMTGGSNNSRGGGNSGSVAGLPNDSLHCNTCWAKIAEKALKTSCDHCFCTKCEANEILQRDRVCPLCSKELRSAQNDDVMEFQIVGGPVLDSQLVELKSMMLAVAFANGNSFFTTFIQSIHTFEKVQSEVRSARDDLLRRQERERFEAAEQEWSRERLDFQHQIEKIAVQCEQMEREFHDSSKESQALREALEERTRQADNWKAMYEALKSGTPMPAASIPRTPARIGESTISNATTLRNISGIDSFVDNNTGRGASNLSGKGLASGYSSTSEHGNRLMVAPSPYRFDSSSNPINRNLQPGSLGKVEYGSNGFFTTSRQSGYASKSQTPLRNSTNYSSSSVLTFHSAASPNVANMREDIQAFSEGDGQNGAKRSRMSSNFGTIPLNQSPQMHHQRHSKIFAKLNQGLEKNPRFPSGNSGFTRRLSSGRGDFGRGNGERS